MQYRTWSKWSRQIYQQIDVRLFVGIIVVEYAGLTDIFYDNHFDDQANGNLLINLSVNSHIILSM